jgi:hypothetical protein
VSLGVASLFQLDFPPQALQIKVAQRIGAETAGLEVLVLGDVWRLLQQVRDAAEDRVAHAVGMETLEQQ